jgi:hypothetical protein
MFKGDNIGIVGAEYEQVLSKLKTSTYVEGLTSV